MHVSIKRIDETLPLPEYHTSGAAGFDFYARERATVAPHSLAKIPSNLIIATPPGYVLIMAARSSLSMKKGLKQANGIGVIDSDYCGPEDEISIAVHNFTDSPVTVERGERIAQGLFVKVEQATWNEVAEMTGKNRGGFGSTGK
jgi:dUTP pyrophosphatase